MEHLRGRSLRCFIGENQPSPIVSDPIGAFLFPIMSKILFEKDLVDKYIEQKIMPYDFDEGDKITYIREFTLKVKNESRRIDLIIYNETKKRSDIIEFKNKPITPRDFLQIYNYYYLFLEQYPIHSESAFCHLVGKMPTSKVAKTILTVGFEKMKVWYFFGNAILDIYEHDYETMKLCDL
jgi:hypothetical protein